MNDSQSAFEILTTADGSLTLNWLSPNGVIEPMHNRQGAMAESLYVYLPALEAALAFSEPLRVASIGLGLGYNELITTAWALKSGLTGHRIVSFEVDSRLRAWLENWSKGKESPLNKVYDDILGRVAAHFGLMREQLLNEWSRVWQNGTFQLYNEFPSSYPENQNNLEWNCVLYDAFSRAASPNLWEEDAIFAALNERLGRPAVFATYASTGSLKRALRRLGFGPCERAGFGGKRESTFAIRGIKS